jgi:phospho-N-acetylmuramoyl-pentapeptide-transferase
MVLVMVSAIIIGPYIISRLRELKFGQNVRLDGPESHLVKQGIPSMGGIIFLLTSGFFATVLSGLDGKVVFMVLTMFGFGFIGFLDDYLKIRKKSSDGLSAKHKMLLLIAVATVAGVYLSTFAAVGTSLQVPFIDKAIPLGILYIPFVIVFFASVTNAVNLTDGIDGLSSSVTIMVLLFYILIASRGGDQVVVLFGFSLVGGLLGFLWFNKYPAKVFMGDTGSLALGGAVGIIALFLKAELLLVFVGIIYVVEALSVIIQVLHFKRTGKRFFRMAPLHHHFEKLGWKESKIVFVFSGITGVMAILMYLLR